MPIGLFGDFYSHELSFVLINTNELKNLKIIFDKCNLKIKKILTKSFIKGVNISENYKNIDTFFRIKINDNNSKIFYFENNALKFEQNFKFGTEIISGTRVEFSKSVPSVRCTSNSIPSISGLSL